MRADWRRFGRQRNTEEGFSDWPLCRPPLSYCKRARWLGDGRTKVKYEEKTKEALTTQKPRWTHVFHNEQIRKPLLLLQFNSA